MSSNVFLQTFNTLFLNKNKIMHRILSKFISFFAQTLYLSQNYLVFTSKNSVEKKIKSFFFTALKDKTTFNNFTNISC